MSKDFWYGYITAAVVGILSIMLIGSPVKCADLIEFVIMQEAIEQGLDPVVALAIAEVESHKNPHVTGTKGEIGLFQIRPEFVANDVRPLLFDVRINAKIGVQKLLYFKSACPSRTGLDWIGCYNQGLRNPKYPQKLPYYKKVMKVIGAK